MAGHTTHHHTNGPNHSGMGHRFEKLEKVEGWADTFTLIGILALGAAMAFGLLTATGHVTW